MARGGDGGRAARASLIDRPVISIRPNPSDLLVLRFIATARGTSINSLITEILASWIQAHLPKRD